MLWPLTVATALLFASVLSYGVAMTLIVRVAVRMVRGGSSSPGITKSTALMSIVTLITAIAHLTQIALWAVAFLLCGQFSDFETAFYYSAQNYTALGYGDVLPSEQWRLLGPLEAINGLLAFGLSTAVLFAILNRLIANHFRTEIGNGSEGAVNEEPLSAAGDRFSAAEYRS
jgi:hypothetical protein